MEAWKQILQEEKIDRYAPISFSACHVQKERLLDFTPTCAVMLAVPYLTEPPRLGKISLYAVSEDYHLYYADLFDRILPKLEQSYPASHWKGFTDHSPIDERDAAARAGLGVFGDSGMLIDGKYGTFVFLGELITDYPIDCPPPREPQGCEHCGACSRACPGKDPCLSALTQKKGELSEVEIERILRYQSAWGCDRCQICCPHNRDVPLSPIPFFARNRMPNPTAQQVEEMTEEAFSRRAFAWRGRKTILRNLRLMENVEKKKSDLTET